MKTPIECFGRRVLLGATLVACLAGCLFVGGCRGKAAKANLDELLIASRRFNIDEERGLARIYARLDNTGEGRFQRVEVHATLRSAGGDKRGENTLTLENIKPHEKRVFALTVTSHGRVSDVELEIAKPETP